jgi:hypothetical protein
VLKCEGDLLTYEVLIVLECQEAFIRVVVGKRNAVSASELICSEEPVLDSALGDVEVVDWQMGEMFLQVICSAASGR